MHYRGWGLIETLLTLGTISALSIGVYMAFAPTDATAKTKAEQEHVRQFVERIGNSYGLLNNYSNISNANLISDNLVPSGVLQGNRLFSSWSSPITLAPYQVRVPNDSFVITYSNTPKEVCNRLASVISTEAYDVLINGSSVLSSTRAFNPISTVVLCQEGADLSFVFTGYGSIAYAADPLDLPPPPTSVRPPLDTPVTNVVDAPDDVDDAIGLPPAVTAPVTPPTVVSPPPITPVSPTPLPISPSIVPPVIPSIPVVVACSIPSSDFQNVNTCSVGSFGQFRLVQKHGIALL